MKKSNPIAFDLIIETYESALIFHESGRKNQAIILLQWIADALCQNINLFIRGKKDRRIYMERFYLNELTDFKNDIKSVKDRLGNIDEILSRFGSYIHIIDNGIKNYALNWKQDYVNPKHKVKNYSIAFSVGLCLICVGLMVYIGWNYVYGRKHSLMGEYFRDVNLNYLHDTRYDAAIDFRWGRSSPLWGFKDDQFSIRWTGYIIIPESSEYEFKTQSDDGVRLWINEVLLIDNWTEHSLTADKRKIKINKGIYPIKLEYFDGSASATIRLFWKYRDRNFFKIIPRKSFLSSQKYIK